MKLIQIYNTLVEEEKIDATKALKQGFYTVKGEDPKTGAEVDYIVNITGFKKYFTQLEDLYNSLKFYKEADVPENLKLAASNIMSEINKIRKDIREFDSTLHVYQQTIK